MKKRLLEVYDEILIEDHTHISVVTITKVTKTKAMALVIKKGGASYEYTFKREIIDGLVLFEPHAASDTTKLRLLTK